MFRRATDMRRFRTFLLVIAMLVGLGTQTAAPAAAPLMGPAMSQPCLACADMPGDCERQCLPCPEAIGCLANAGCVLPVAVSPSSSASLSEWRLIAAYARLALATLSSRSVKPEQHPPSS